MKEKLLPLCLAITLLFTGCMKAGTDSEQSWSEPAASTFNPIPAPLPDPYQNPLTGEGCKEYLSQSRPVAIMINNLKKALPQTGISSADIIYEVPAEGGITRLLAVFQSIDGVGDIGTVRSARDYYVSLAAGLDAIYMHAGGSPGAYSAIKNWGVTALDCVNGPYEGTLYWRDAQRRKDAGYEHSVLTSGEKIAALFPTYNLRLTHPSGYSAPFSFTEEVSMTQSAPATKISVTFSSYKTGVFDYDSEAGLYLVSQHGNPHMDIGADKQLAMKNVLILKTDISVIDSEGRLSVKLVGSGNGQFACNGEITDIKWQKSSDTGAMTFTKADGTALDLGIGKSYICIIGTGSTYGVTIE